MWREPVGERMKYEVKSNDRVSRGEDSGEGNHAGSTERRDKLRLARTSRMTGGNVVRVRTTMWKRG